MLDAPDLELLLDHGAQRGAVSRAELEQAGEQHPGFALELRVTVGELEPVGPARRHGRAVERGDGALDRHLADVLAVAAGVAIERAADRPRDPGRELEAGELVVAALVDQLEEVGAAADVRGAAVELDALD